MDKFEQWIKGLWTNWLTTLLPLLTSINGIFAFFFFPHQKEELVTMEAFG